ncbi:MAG: hypothetical protein ACOYZ8_00420 [Chloroflexota bacterium]
MIALSGVGVFLIVFVVGLIGWTNGWFSGLPSERSGLNPPGAEAVESDWSEQSPPSAEDFEDGVQPIAIVDAAVQPPAFTPEEVTFSDAATFSVDLGNPNEDPNDGRPIIAEYQGYKILFMGGMVTMADSSIITGFPLNTELAQVANLPIRLDGMSLGSSVMPPPGFGLGTIISLGTKVGELGRDGVVSIYDSGKDATEWAGEQLGNAADATWDGTQWVANKTVDASVWVGQQVVDGGQWVWDGTKYVLVKTKDVGMFVWDESVKGGRWVYKKGKAVVEWIALHYDFEKVCGPKGEPGPGSGPSGTGALEYPKPGYQAPEGKEDFLTLARAWMPYLQMSKDEKCGEIRRVIAKVFPYRDNSLVSNLEDADRVEIVYTLVFSYDGGRWYGGTHPGDNEGFVIGLLPTDNTYGRCGATDPHFQFYAGRTVKHKDVDTAPGLTVENFLYSSALLGFPAGPATLGLAHMFPEPANEVVRWAGFEKGIEDFNWHELGTTCPEVNPSSYSLWVAESKHATYFSQEECEKTLLGWEVAGITLGGLEECESGRPPSDLRDRVELWSTSMAAEPSPIHGKSYDDVSRGHAENPSDLYHVPMLECPDFDTASAIPIRFTGIPDDSQWTVTVIGMGEFDPMVGVSGDPLFCNDDSDAASNYSVSGIPGYGDYSGSRRSAQISFTVIDGGERTFYVDSRDGKPGAFVAIFESADGGIGISPVGDKDNIYVWGVEGGDMGVYVISEDDSLDLYLSNPTSGHSSDDESSMTGFSMVTSLGTYFGHPTDSYLNLDLKGATGEREFVIEALQNTTGRYAVIVIGGNIPIEGQPAAPTIPVIESVTGPSSIPADGQEYSFTVRFSDEGGDVNRLVVNGLNGIWDTIDFNPMNYLESGNGYSGTTTFSYRCNTGSSSFSDTLQILLYDSAGNVSEPYTFALSCTALTPITYAPVITSVSGPSSIPADSERHYFRLSFTDADGDVNRLVVTSDNGRWDRIDSGPPLSLDSGDQYSGTLSFYYFCTESSSFSDTLRIKLYDAAGNVSNTYPFDLECEYQSESLEFPPQRFASHVSLSFSGGHGSTHRVGESVQLCYTFTDTYFGEGGVYEFYLYDFQPASPGSDGVNTSGPHQLLASGDADEGTHCLGGTISSPTGYEAFRLELYQPGYPSDIFLEFAELWIYVQP